MAGKADAFLKISLGLAFLLAAGSVGYHFAVYIPARDSQLDNDRRLEKVHAEFARKSAEDRAQAERDADERRAKAEQEASEERQAAARAQAQSHYVGCIDRAARNYSLNWASNCKGLAESAKKKRAACTFSPSSCDNIYPARDPGPNCSLPTDLASTLTNDLNRDRDRCLHESRAGLQ